MSESASGSKEKKNYRKVSADPVGVGQSRRRPRTVADSDRVGQSRCGSLTVSDSDRVDQSRCGPRTVADSARVGQSRCGSLTVADSTGVDQSRCGPRIVADSARVGQSRCGPLTVADSTGVDLSRCGSITVADSILVGQSRCGPRTVADSGRVGQIRFGSLVDADSTSVEGDKEDDQSAAGSTFITNFFRSVWKKMSGSVSNSSEQEEYPEFIDHSELTEDNLDSPRYRPQSIESLCRATKFSETEIKKIYRNFKSECPTGTIRQETFKGIYAKFFPYGVASYRYAHYVFNTLDHNKLGYLNFEDFVKGLSVLCRGSKRMRS
ncbi:hypothetical protein WDU94_012793 [Cyamophila willieti]